MALDEFDLRLLHVLQISPRVSWTDAAGVLGSSPATVAARWQRLRDEGQAWVVAHPSGVAGPVTTAFVEVDCRPGSLDAVLDRLVRDPRVVSIDQSAPGADLLLTVMTRDQRAMAELALDDLPRVEGIARRQVYYATAIHRQGRDWRLDALDAAERSAIEATRRRTGGASTAVTEDSWPIVEILGRDGRATAADIARQTDRPPATARRQLARLLATGTVSVRCETARDPSLWPFQCSWAARVPERERDRTIAALSTLPEVRLLASTMGVSNLRLDVWARSQDDLMRIEKLVGDLLPWLSITESTLNLRSVKRMGWLVDAEGRATGEVVVPDALRPRARG